MSFCNLDFLYKQKINAQPAGNCRQLLIDQQCFELMLTLMNTKPRVVQSSIHHTALALYSYMFALKRFVVFGGELKI
jgi:hypothetical protein